LKKDTKNLESNEQADSSSEDYLNEVIQYRNFKIRRREAPLLHKLEKRWGEINRAPRDVKENDYACFIENDSIVQLALHQEGGVYLQSIPDQIVDLIFLKKLYLQYFYFKSLPDSIGNLINLEELYLSDNHLTELPESIGNLKNLKTLDLSSNRITKLPESIGNLKNLKSLDLYLNRIESLPESFSNLVNLEYLDLHLRSDYSYKWLEDNPKLDLPEGLSNFTKLKTLKIMGRKLENIPNLENCKDLTCLSLSGANLTEFPHWILKLTNLEELYLDGNYITDIPEDIVKLTKLKVFSVSHNKLSTFPKSIDTFANQLKKFPIHNNPFQVDQGYLSNLQQIVINN
jgi:leucine-rich repeat protein SHOC2